MSGRGELRRQRARRRSRRMLILSGAGAVLVLAALVGGSLVFAGGSPRHRARISAPRAPAPTTAPAPPTTTLPPGVSLVAQAKAPQVPIYDDPTAPAPSKTLPNPWLLNNEADKPITQAFLVEQQRPDGWVQVLLPERPNGSTGWIHASDVTLSQNPYHIQVSLSTHQITVFNGQQSIYQGPVATGAPNLPTPTGTYYIRVLLRTIDPKSVYGPYAYGLSAHSDVLTQFDGGDAEVGIHGNNDAAVLGKSVTHGCVRMDNGEITQLAKVLPLGTPVEIAA